MASMGSFLKPNIFSPPKFLLRSPLMTRTKNPNGIFRAHLNDDNDPLFLHAKNAALLRYLESYQSEPLFVDPYAGCFVAPNLQIMQYSRQYCFVTKFVDDKLLQALFTMDGFKQVVLLTDGMDTRPYRLAWPVSTIIFDISPESVFKRAAQELQVNGAKIFRSTLLNHVPLESPDIQQELHSKGFRGDRPSVWAMQGLPIRTIADFQNLLSIISSLAVKGSLFFGELPSWLAETETKFTSSTSVAKRMEKIFMDSGFWVDTIGLEEVAKRLGKEITSGEPYENIPFAAKQLRFSDDQMDIWREEFERIEEDGDEDGFEEL